MVRTLARVLIALTIILPISCVDLGEPPPEGPTALIPLEVGNYWQYVDSIYYVPGGIRTYSFTWSVVGTKTIRWAGQAMQVYVFREGNFDAYYRNTPDGLIRYIGDDSSAGAFETRLLKYPLHVGDTWKVFQGDYSDVAACMSTDTVISSQGRLFHCYQVRFVSVND